MGEMTDFYITQALNNGEGFAPRWRERTGYYGPRYSRDAPKQPTCSHCGAKGLNWQKIKGSKWRLHQGSEVHVCQPTAEGFEDA